MYVTDTMERYTTMDDKILDAFLKHVSVGLAEPIADAVAVAVEGVLFAFEGRLEARYGLRSPADMERLTRRQRGVTVSRGGDGDGERMVPRGDGVDGGGDSSGLAVEDLIRQRDELLLALSESRGMLATMEGFVPPNATLQACADRVRELEGLNAQAAADRAGLAERFRALEANWDVLLTGRDALTDRVQLADALARKARVVCDKLLRPTNGFTISGQERADLLHLQRLATDHGDAAAAAAKAVDPGPKS